MAPEQGAPVEEWIAYAEALQKAYFVEKEDRKEWAGHYEDAVEALKPFAAFANRADDYRHGDDSTCLWRISARDLRRARAVVERTTGAWLDKVGRT